MKLLPKYTETHPGHSFNIRICSARALLTKCDIKMVGYCQVLFLRFYGPRRTQKENEDNIQTSLPNKINKGLIIWPKDYTEEIRFCGNKAGYPMLARARVPNQNTGFASSCPLPEFISADHHL